MSSVVLLTSTRDKLELVMPYVPKPQRPSTYHEWKEDTSVEYTCWYNNGSFRNSGTRSAIVTTASARVYNRTRNKVKLVSGMPWKPNTSYGSCSYVVTYHAGTSVYRYADGKTACVLNGTAAGLGYQTWVPSYCNGFSGHLPHDPPLNVRNRLATELMQKVGSRKVSYGESLAESRQTVNHLARTARSLFLAYKAARRGRFGEVARHLGVPFKRTRGKTAANKWLEYQYAWMPMMMDIYDTRKLLQEGFRKPQMMSSTRVLRDSERLSVSNGKGPAWQERHVARGEARITYKAKVFYRVNDSALSKLNQLGFINPLEVAWAVQPFSFVVDWFIPVGNFLEALTARLGVDFIDGHYSATIESNASIWPRHSTLFGPIVVGTGVPSTTILTTTQLKSFRRWKYNDFPIPGLYYKNPFSSTHVVSALALLRQLIR